MKETNDNVPSKKKNKGGERRRNNNDKVLKGNDESKM